MESSSDYDDEPQFTKTKYPLIKNKKTISYIIPRSAQVIEIQPQTQRAGSLIAGFCKDNTQLQEVQQIILNFYCDEVDAIEIYMEKCLQRDGPRRSLKAKYDDMGVSACFHQGQVLIGLL